MQESWYMIVNGVAIGSERSEDTSTMSGIASMVLELMEGAMVRAVADGVIRVTTHDRLGTGYMYRHNITWRGDREEMQPMVELARRWHDSPPLDQSTKVRLIKEVTGLDIESAMQLPTLSETSLKLRELISAQV